MKQKAKVSEGVKKLLWLEVTKLKMGCRKHGTQLAEIIMSGEVCCSKCLKEYREKVFGD